MRGARSTPALQALRPAGGRAALLLPRAVGTRARPPSARAVEARARRLASALALPPVDLVELTSNRVVVVLNGLETPNDSNGSHGNPHAKASRRRAQRDRVSAGLLVARSRARAWPAAPPARVTLTRLAPRELDDDNWPHAAKSCRDAVAAFFAVDDGPRGPIRWAYAQRRRDAAGLEVCLEWGAP